ncbi:TolC family protein [Cupriavidus basilensis]|uniref:TolC family protein n=1 Tax=Cupriavidus basilensis TaxID=68895 RepID=A0ABT6B1H6_9BURK|nr:TolC family protein [Cupriavidus basilensis]
MLPIAPSGQRALTNWWSGSDYGIDQRSRGMNVANATLTARPGSMPRILASSRAWFLTVCCATLSACAFDHYDARPISAGTIANTYNERSLASADLRDFIERHAMPSSTNWPPPRWNLDTLTLAALYYNPDLDLARARLASTEASIKTAAQRPNPSLQLPFQRTLNPKGGDSPWTLGIALDIPIQTAGKRGYRIDQATHFASAARLDVANAAWSVRSQLRTQLLNLWLANARTELLKQQLELDQRMNTMLEKRVLLGEASAWEQNQQRLALIQAQADLLDAQRQTSAARVLIANVLGLRSGALDGLDIDLTDFGRPYASVPAPEIRLQALLNRADVLSGLAQYEASQAALQLEVAKQYPDIHLGPGYTFDQGLRKLGFDFTNLVLPIFNRNEGPIAEARARRLEAEAQVKRLEAQALGETDGAITAYQATQSILKRNEEQVSMQGRQLLAARRSFEAGQTDRMALTLAERTELAARLAWQDAEFRMQQAIGRLEDAIQRPLSGRDAGANPNNWVK